MDPQLIDADERNRAPARGFHLREVARAAALTRPFKGTLAAGLIATVLFAGLHTVSIAGAFPVLKILLEHEGLRGWVERTMAGRRVGATFGPIEAADAAKIQVTDLRAHGPLHDQGVHRFDVIWDAQGRTARELLHELAEREADGRVRVLVQTDKGDIEAVPRTVDLAPADPADGALDVWTMRGLRWAASAIPAGADTDRGKLTALTYILVGLVVLVLVANVFRFLGEVLIARAVLRAMMVLRARLYDRVLRLPMTYFAGYDTADLVTRFVQDIQEVQRGLMTLFGKFVREPLRAVFILGLAFTLDWRITLTMVVATPLVVAIFWAIGRSVKKANRKLLQSYGAMIGALTASLQNLRVVKAYTAEDHERARLGKVDLRMFVQQLRLAGLHAFTSPMIEMLGVVAASVVTVWLASLVLAHELTPAKFMQLGFTLSVLFDPLRKLSDVYVRLQRSTAGAERIFQVLDEPIESPRAAAATELAPLTRGIEYAGVTFTYPGATRPALRDVNMTVHCGETVAIVGPNGCGKTTLVSMLPRFFDPDEGEIRYDGVDLRAANLKSLRGMISLVSQEAIVFAGTPTENIAYGHADPDPDRVRHAARRASADDFIRAVPGGYDGALGERGATLSGGQRQRLVIARAIFRDAPILIFDEATSQIDTESEQKIQAALKEFATGRTTLIIAHRLSTIQFATRIIMMDTGRIIDTGTHAELLDRCTPYRTLCETQFVQ
ncbi:MAG: ABC transporter ATP-binding protein [Phycisphaerae bacterium]